MKKKKYKIKYQNILLVLDVILIIYSLFNLGKYFKDRRITLREIDMISNVKIIAQTDNNTEIVERKNDIYLDYANINLIYVDFEELKLINNDVLGWIQLLGTNINYPFVQYHDNNYYLNHSFTKEKNSAGWIFLDYRNTLNDKHLILYAHGMSNKTMFGSLKYLFNSNWYSNKNNHYIKNITDNYLGLWQVFSVYKISNTTDYLQINFNNNEEYLFFVNKLKNRSHYPFNILLTENDPIITLSTCYNQNYKIVMHAKLIKKEDLKSSQ